MNGEKLSIDFIRTIIVNGLGIDPKRVNIYNQKFLIPPGDGLFVYIDYRGAAALIASRNATELVEGDFVEVQDINMLERVAVCLFSKNLDALRMKERVPMALGSIFSQQLQEQESFRIFDRGAKPVALSMLEASAQLYRFDCEFNVQTWYNNTQLADYYDRHSVAIRVNDGVPDLTAEFDIPDTDPILYPKT